MRRLMANGRVSKKPTSAPSISPQEPLSPDRARSLILQHRAEPGLRVLGHLDLRAASDLYYLPDNLTCESLDISDCVNLTALPPGLHVRHWIELAGSGITQLSAGHGFTLRWRGVEVSGSFGVAQSANRIVYCVSNIEL